MRIHQIKNAHTTNTRQYTEYIVQMEFSYNFRRKPHRATTHQDNVPLQLRCSDYVEVDHIGSGEDDTENHIAATIQFHRGCFDCGATREN